MSVPSMSRMRFPTGERPILMCRCLEETDSSQRRETNRCVKYASQVGSEATKASGRTLQGKRAPQRCARLSAVVPRGPVRVSEPLSSASLINSFLSQYHPSATLFSTCISLSIAKSVQSVYVFQIVAHFRLLPCHFRFIADCQSTRGEGGSPQRPPDTRPRRPKKFLRPTLNGLVFLPPWSCIASILRPIRLLMIV